MYLFNSSVYLKLTKVLFKYINKTFNQVKLMVNMPNLNITGYSERNLCLGLTTEIEQVV